MHPPDGPPICAALKALPLGMPPPMSKINSRSGMTMGTSTRPVLLILPTTEKIIVPLLFSVPRVAYQSAPFSMMIGTDAQLLTLLMLVGLPHSPLSAGYGGRARGSPTRPSMEAISADSSPHTNAPAPS